MSLTDDERTAVVPWPFGLRKTLLGISHPLLRKTTLSFRPQGEIPNRVLRRHLLGRQGLHLTLLGISHPLLRFAAPGVRDDGVGASLRCAGGSR